ncbi:MAG: dihydrofolate reductase, partial [Promicromonosporaceae bacterium]|nr:dihydrofolate reductase [Promicromonosporaceae bacterium]
GPLDPAVAERVNLVVSGHYLPRERWEHLRALPRLDYLQIASAGYEHVLEFVPPGAILCNGRGVHSAGTSELAVALILASQRGLDRARDAQHRGQWWTGGVTSLADRRVLVIGAGSVAQALVRRLEPFEVEIVVVDRHAGTMDDGRVTCGLEDLDALLPAADIVALTVPYNPSTHHLLDARRLALLPAGALVCNVARGGVIDQDALLAELQGGRLRAALDVMTPEPLPEDHPLWRAPNTLLTAHLGGRTDATGPRFAALIRRQLRHLVAGEPLENQVTR